MEAVRRVCLARFSTTVSTFARSARKSAVSSNVTEEHESEGDLQQALKELQHEDTLEDFDSLQPGPALDITPLPGERVKREKILPKKQKQFQLGNLPADEEERVSVGVKQKRVAAAIQRAITEAIYRDNAAPDLELHNMEVTIAKGHRSAHVYWTAPNEASVADVAAAIPASLPGIKRLLAARLNFKYVPYLIFKQSLNETRMQEIDALFDKVKQDPAYIRALQEEQANALAAVASPTNNKRPQASISSKKSNLKTATESKDVRTSDCNLEASEQSIAGPEQTHKLAGEHPTDSSSREQQSQSSVGKE